MATEAETGVIQPQAKKCQHHHKLEETKNEFFPGAYGGKVASLSLGFDAVKLISSFVFLELQENTFPSFKPSNQH